MSKPTPAQILKAKALIKEHSATLPARARALHAQGLSLQAIGDLLGVSKQYIWQVIKKETGK